MIQNRLILFFDLWMCFLRFSKSLLLLLLLNFFGDVIVAQHDPLFAFQEGMVQAENPSVIGVNYNFSNVDQIVINYNKQWLESPVGPKHVSMAADKVFLLNNSSLGAGINVRYMDFGGAYTSWRAGMGSRYQVKVSSGVRLFFGVSLNMEMYQANFGRVTIVDAGDPNLVSNYSQNIFSAPAGFSLLMGRESNFSYILFGSMNNVLRNSIPKSSIFDLKWNASVQLLNNYREKKSDMLSLNSIKVQANSDYGNIGKLAEGSVDFGIHLGEVQPQFRFGFYYRHDMTNLKFNSVGVKISVTPKDVSSLFGGLGYSLLTLGNSGNLGNVMGTFLGWQRVEN